MKIVGLWTVGDTYKLSVMAKKGLYMDEISNALGKCTKTIQYHARRNGIKIKRRLSDSAIMHKVLVSRRSAYERNKEGFDYTLDFLIEEAITSLQSNRSYSSDQ